MVCVLSRSGCPRRFFRTKSRGVSDDSGSFYIYLRERTESSRPLRNYFWEEGVESKIRGLRRAAAAICRTPNGLLGSLRFQSRHSLRACGFHCGSFLRAADAAGKRPGICGIAALRARPGAGPAPHRLPISPGRRGRGISAVARWPIRARSEQVTRNPGLIRTAAPASPRMLTPLGVGDGSARRGAGKLT
jgi:hypothetical protein